MARLECCGSVCQPDRGRGRDTRQRYGYKSRRRFVVHFHSAKLARSPIFGFVPLAW